MFFLEDSLTRTFSMEKALHCVYSASNLNIQELELIPNPIYFFISEFILVLFIEDLIFSISDKNVCASREIN